LSARGIDQCDSLACSLRRQIGDSHSRTFARKDKSGGTTRSGSSNGCSVFAKVRYRGLAKNTHRLVVTCALANLFMARRHLLRSQ